MTLHVGGVCVFGVACLEAPAPAPLTIMPVVAGRVPGGWMSSGLTAHCLHSVFSRIRHSRTDGAPVTTLFCCSALSHTRLRRLFFTLSIAITHVHTLPTPQKKICRPVRTFIEPFSRSPWTPPFSGCVAEDTTPTATTPKLPPPPATLRLSWPPRIWHASRRTPCSKPTPSSRRKGTGATTNCKRKRWRPKNARRKCWR